MEEHEALSLRGGPVERKLTYMPMIGHRGTCLHNPYVEIRTSKVRYKTIDMIRPSIAGKHYQLLLTNQYDSCSVYLLGCRE